MDEPLFGEQKKSTKVLVYILGALIGAFLLFSVIVGFVFGFKGKGGHVVLSFVLLLLGSLLFFLFRWYQANELDPKFRWIIAGLVLTLIVGCIAINIYAWAPKVIHPSEKCHNGNGFYMKNSNRCIEISGSIDRCQGEGMCLCFDRWFPEARATCMNCTDNKCKGVPLPKPPAPAPPGPPGPPGAPVAPPPRQQP